MGTRSTIIAKREDGRYAAIYCHFDGYPSHMLAALAGHATQAAAEALVMRGDACCIQHDPRQCQMFGEGANAEPWDDIQPSCADTPEGAYRAHADRGGNEHVYLWDGSTWAEVDMG